MIFQKDGKISLIEDDYEKNSEKNKSIEELKRLKRILLKITLSKAATAIARGRPG